MLKKCNIFRVVIKPYHPMDNKTNSLEVPQKGNILIINTGSTTTKLGYFSDGVRVFDTKLEHTAEDVAK